MKPARVVLDAAALQGLHRAGALTALVGIVDALFLTPELAEGLRAFGGAAGSDRSPAIDALPGLQILAPPAGSPHRPLIALSKAQQADLITNNRALLQAARRAGVVAWTPLNVVRELADQGRIDDFAASRARMEALGFFSLLDPREGAPAFARPRA